MAIHEALLREFALPSFLKRIFLPLYGDFIFSTFAPEKSAKIGQRQIALAKEWYAGGLILEAEYRRVIGSKP